MLPVLAVPSRRSRGGGPRPVRQKTIRSVDATPEMVITSREGIELTVNSVTAVPNGTREPSHVLLTVSALGLSGGVVRGNADLLTITVR